MDLIEFCKLSVDNDPKAVKKLINEEIRELEKEFELAAEREDIYRIGYITGKISGLKVSALLVDIMQSK